MRPRALAVWTLALPAGAHAAGLDGSHFSAWWALPFAGMLLSIALMPLLVPSFWHHHFGKVAAGWSLAFVLPFALSFGPTAAGTVVVHTLLAEYIPFIALLVKPQALCLRVGSRAAGPPCFMALPREWQTFTLA